jgi:transposase
MMGPRQIAQRSLFYAFSTEDHDAPACRVLLTQLQPGQLVLADKAYDADWIRELIWEQGAIAVTPSKSNRKLPKEFDADLYKQRNRD